MDAKQLKKAVENAAFPVDIGRSVGLGITKREYFAAMALQGCGAAVGWDAKTATAKAVECADALIAALAAK